jgi:threonine dehydrogenase-like Zn-dependent dehydrogenase
VHYPYPTELEPGAVLLRMLASGICGTDKHTYRGETQQYAGTDHASSTPFPIIQGHENVGRSSAIGDGGASAFDGTPLPSATASSRHRTGRAALRVLPRRLPVLLLPQPRELRQLAHRRGAPHLFGGFGEYLYLRPGTPVFPVPDGLPTRVAVLTELFA